MGEAMDDGTRLNTLETEGGIGRSLGSPLGMYPTRNFLAGAVDQLWIGSTEV